MRALALLIIAALMAFVVIYGLSERRVANYGMPMVASAMSDPPPIKLFAPCPVTQRNFPHANMERTA